MASFTSDIGNEAPAPRLRDVLEAALPKGFDCRVRYVHTPPKPCDPLYSAPPGEDNEPTRLASHFLTVSIPTVASSAHQFVFAMEVVVYSTRKLTTIFVSKADSTGLLPHRRPSPVKVLAATFLRWLSDRLRRPQKCLVISLFARSQATYLFPGSEKGGTKHVLTDRQLTAWWNDSGTSLDRDRKWQGFITVPGFSGMSEVRTFLPRDNTSSARPLRWKHGDPLRELAVTRGLSEIAPTRCLLPRFPDDPKARFMQDLDDEVGLTEDTVNASPSKKKQGPWQGVRSLDNFWTVMESRQECASGQVVGFLWLVEQGRPISGQDAEVPGTQLSSSQIDLVGGHDQHNGESQESQLSQQSITSHSSSRNGSSPRKRRGRLTGPIVARQPRLKGGSSNISATSEPNLGLTGDRADGPMLTSEGYDCAMKTLLQLDFSSAEEAARSTTKWVSVVGEMVGLTPESWEVNISGTAEVTVQSEAVGAPGTNDLGSLIRKKKRKNEDPTVAVAEVDLPPPVNTLVGRKKLKA